MADDLVNTHDTKSRTHIGLSRISGERRLGVTDTSWVIIKSEVCICLIPIYTWLLRPPDRYFHHASLFNCPGLELDP